MAQHNEPLIMIEDLHPKDTIGGYKAACEESGLIAWADLLPIDDQPQRGFLLDCGYNTLTGRDPGPRQIERGTTLTSKVRIRMLEAMRAAGWREIGGQPGTWQHLSRMVSQQVPVTREQVKLEQTAPVEQVSVTREQVKLKQIAPLVEQVSVTREQVKLEQTAPLVEQVPITLEVAKPDQVLRVNRKRTVYQRTVSARLVTGICQACHQSFAEMRYPGPPPRYCGKCAKEVERKQRNARRMRSHYKSKRAAADSRAHPASEEEHR